MALNLGLVAVATAAGGFGFLAGALLARLDDPTLDPPATVSALPPGDYADVELELQSSSGTFRYLCDLHIPPLARPPSDEDSTAVCTFAP